jgi:phosphatidylglycerophosphate synthase
MRAVLPNLVTALRGLAGPAVAWLVLGPGWDQAAFWLFLAAILTDLVDGSLARALGATSRVGRWLDPLSDKVLAICTWTALGLVGWAPAWLVVGMLVRHAGVAVGWAFLRGRPVPASLLGRVMVSFEGVALPVLLFRQPWVDVHWMSVGTVLGGISLALAAVSAALYLPRLLRAPSPATPALPARDAPPRALVRDTG